MAVSSIHGVSSLLGTVCAISWPLLLSVSVPTTSVARTQDAAGQLVTVATVTAKPGKADALREATVPLISLTRREPGVITYFLHEDLEKPGHFVFYEVFRDSKAFQDHVAASYVQHWLALLPDLTVDGLTVTKLKVL